MRYKWVENYTNMVHNKQNMVFLKLDVEKRQIRVLFDHLLILSHGCRPHWENRTSFLSHIGVAPSGSIADKNRQILIQTSHFCFSSFRKLVFVSIISSFYKFKFVSFRL